MIYEVGYKPSDSNKSSQNFNTAVPWKKLKVQSDLGGLYLDCPTTFE